MDMILKACFVDYYMAATAIRQILSKTTLVLVNSFCPVLLTTSLCFNKMELQEIQFDTSAEYALVYDDEEINTEYKVTIPNEQIQSTTGSSEAKAAHNDSTSSDEPSKSMPTNVPRPSKKLVVELFDENMYSLPDNALPESEPSSPVLCTSSVQKKPALTTGWVCSTRTLVAVVLSIFLLNGGIFLAVYLPMTLQGEYGKPGTYMITISR